MFGYYCLHHPNSNSQWVKAIFLCFYDCPPWFWCHQGFAPRIQTCIIPMTWLLRRLWRCGGRFSYPSSLGSMMLSSRRTIWLWLTLGSATTVTFFALVISDCIVISRSFRHFNLIHVSRTSNMAADFLAKFSLSNYCFAKITHPVWREFSLPIWLLITIEISFYHKKNVGLPKLKW